MASLMLSAPLHGWCLPLDEVPDPVFAGRMLGDGLAIDPVGDCLHAPCDGEVLSVHAGRHAVTLRAAEGAELLIHVGVDTVALGGEGFTVHVAEGQRVARGDRLVSFDLPRLLARAPAVVTPMLLTNGDRFQVGQRVLSAEVKVGAPVMEIVPRAGNAERREAGAGPELRRRVRVPLAHGLHARPAARIAALAKEHDAVARAEKAGRSANLRSPTGLLTLGIRRDDEIELVAQGAQADALLHAVATLIEGGMGELPDAIATEPPLPPSPAPVAEAGTLFGVTASPGLAVGVTARLVAADRVVEREGAGVGHERARLAEAIAAVRARLATGGHHAGAGIAAAHRAILVDPDLLEAADQAIAGGAGAAFAWREALRSRAEALRGTGEPLLAERADDLLDMERQLLSALCGEEERLPLFEPGTVLLADDLLPSQVMAIDPAAVVGLCTARGGPTSHVAILAAGMGLPALVAMGDALAAVADGTAVILDAGAGRLRIDPAAEELGAARAAVEAQAAALVATRAAAAGPAFTRDGVRIEAFANLASAADARVAVENGAEGCGLLRTEFLFLDRAAAPGEEEQVRDYQAIADALDGRPLIVRLLDVGGDKPAPYLSIAPEENPALGLRGIRVALARPEVLRMQLRAILQVRPSGQCRIMVPMVASPDELAAVRAALDEAKAELGVTAPVPLGIMVETPAAAAIADLLAADADFLSVGSNDLTQYVLAMDRGNPAVAAGVDGLHPAVLRLIGQACAGGARHGRWTGVCGGLASDPLAVPILLGLGVTELSATPALVPAIKAVIRRVDLPACRDLADRAVAQRSAAAVRALACAFHEELRP